MKFRKQKTEKKLIYSNLFYYSVNIFNDTRKCEFDPCISDKTKNSDETISVYNGRNNPRR